MIYTILLFIHILAGSIAVTGALIAIFTKIGYASHTWHVYGGRAFFGGMLFVFVTTLLMTVLKPNLFLFLIGIFSFYLAFTGWRMAKNRAGVAGIADKIAAWTMAVTSAGMIGWGIYLAIGRGGNGITLLLFGLIGGGLAFRDFRGFSSGPIRGKDRISAHLTGMMAATIAAVTAVLVVNVETRPVWIAWIAPTVVITPLIIWMNRRLYAGK